MRLVRYSCHPLRLSALTGRRAPAPMTWLAAILPLLTTVVTAVVLTLAWPLFETPAASATSFTCNETNTPVEAMICASPELSKLDDDLDRAFQTAHENSDQPYDLTMDQLAWLRLRDACADQACLISSYRERLAILQNAATSSSTMPSSDASPSSESAVQE